MKQSKIEYFMNLAKYVAVNSTCIRSNVGCVLVDSEQHIIATGCNGAPKGVQHCSDVNFCNVDEAKPARISGDCIAVHAEQNALIQCTSKDIAFCFCTKMPCITCLKMLLNTPCTTIVYEQAYVTGMQLAMNLWADSRRKLIKLIEKVEN